LPPEARTTRSAEFSQQLFGEDKLSARVEIGRTDEYLEAELQVGENSIEK
jgi:hypothetical protein